MRHASFKELRDAADIQQIRPATRWDVRRARLSRWADLIEHAETPVRLFHQLEFIPQAYRNDVRSPESPLDLAFADSDFRSQGLRSNDYGSAVEFFELSAQESHQILCDCHYAGAKPTPQMIASRIRNVAERRSLIERLDGLRSRIASWI